MVEAPSRRRIDLGRQSVEQIEVVAQDIGGAGEHVDGVTLGDVGEQRERFVADPVAAERRIGVRRIGRHRQAERLAQRHRLVPADGEQRLGRAG